MAAASADEIDVFIERWRAAGGAERANYVLFLTELCDILGVERPRPAPSDYSFEYPVTFRNAGERDSTGWIDLYRKDCFVLEAKQGSDQEAAQLPLFGIGNASATRRGTAVRGTDQHTLAMQRARGQAEGYAKALPASHGWPPFLIVADVGHSIELFADFSRTGKNYAQFPDAQRFRIGLDDLRRQDMRSRLATVWTEPMSLDPSRERVRMTRDIAERLAELGRSLEQGRDPEMVATFVMRCLFTMFAQNVGLLPKDSFVELLQEIVDEQRPERFRHDVDRLWRAMDKGEYDPNTHQTLKRFNGGLFADVTCLDLKIEEIGVLLAAAKRDWSDVEPAIFGTLLERALDKKERHRLGAHFTPRAYVERLVMPTVIEPLREEWGAVQASAMLLASQGKEKDALVEIARFHQSLCKIRVLDPACGTGNFLYVSMELMKRLEGEVIEAARALGEDQHVLDLDRHTVDPHQFLGIELNPRAAVIAELVLWIGYLQWHFRTRGKVAPAEPVLKNFKNIRAGDALITFDAREEIRDEHGRPVTRWDGTTRKPHPITGEDVPDETERVIIYRYVNPRPVAWPEAHFIVGNPPFQGGKDLRDVLGDDYTQALWKAYRDIPRSADLVMYWWHKAASTAAAGKALRFGLITTNSITQVFNRRVVAKHLSAEKPISLVFAIPDHPWVTEKGAAAVRVAMTVALRGEWNGLLLRPIEENLGIDGVAQVAFKRAEGQIGAKLSAGADLTRPKALKANDFLCSPGVKLHGKGFIVSATQARWLG